MNDFFFSSKTITKSLRCPEFLDSEIDRVKTAIMVKSGLRFSDNRFMIELLELGLITMKQKAGILKPAEVVKNAD